MTGSSVVTTRGSFIPPLGMGCCGVAHTTVPGDITPSPVPHPRGARSGRWEEEEVGGGPAVPSCAGWHGAGGSWTFPPRSTPSSLLLFVGSTAPGTHGSDFGEAGEEVVGTRLQTAPWSLLPWGGIVPLLPPSSSSRPVPWAPRLPELTMGCSGPSKLEMEVVPSITAQVSHQCPAPRHRCHLSPPWGPSQPVLLPVVFPA